MFWHTAAAPPQMVAAAAVVTAAPPPSTSKSAAAYRLAPVKQMFMVSKKYFFAWHIKHLISTRTCNHGNANRLLPMKPKALNSIARCNNSEKTVNIGGGGGSSSNSFWNYVCTWWKKFYTVPKIWQVCKSSWQLLQHATKQSCKTIDCCYLFIKFQKCFLKNIS